VKVWDPLYYDQNCVMQYRTALKRLNNIRIDGNESVLDIGSGSGKITYEISCMTEGQVIGVDASEAMVLYANKHYHAENLTFVFNDVLKINYQNTFDVAISFWTLSWVENQLVALQNIVNALKPNGRMYLMYPMRHDAYDVADIMISSPYWRKYFGDSFLPRPFVSETSYKEIASAVIDAELTVNRLEIPCLFESWSEMQESIRSWMPHLDHLPNEKLKQEFVDEFVHEYANHRRVTTPIMYFNVLEITGSKKLELIKQNDELIEPCLKFKAKL